MSDRVIRDELLESDRWLDLPSDTHRLVFVGLVLLADDFGNLEGGRRLWRTVHSFTQLKSFEDFLRLMSELQDADLARRYEVGGRELFHLPRFRPHRQYFVRKFPPSPWDQDHELGKATRRIVTRGLARDHELNSSISNDVATTSRQRGSDVAQGVGVGVGVGVKVLEAFDLGVNSTLGAENQRSSSSPKTANSDARTILEFLNRKTGRHFRPTTKTLEPILARLRDGATVGECKAVVMHRLRAWANDDKMRDCLRPKTLFAASNFANYLGDVPPADELLLAQS